MNGSPQYQRVIHTEHQAGLLTSFPSCPLISLSDVCQLCWDGSLLILYLRRAAFILACTLGLMDSWTACSRRRRTLGLPKLGRRAEHMLGIPAVAGIPDAAGAIVGGRQQDVWGGLAEVHEGHRLRMPQQHRHWVPELLVLLAAHVSDAAAKHSRHS